MTDTVNFKIASVAVDKAIYSFDKLFDYIIPATLCSVALPGCRVLVPFGGGNKTRQGIIMSIHELSYKPEKYKYIKDVLDSEPILSDEMLKLASFIKERYFCTFYDAVKTMLPTGINYKLSMFYNACDLSEEAYDKLDEREKSIYNYILAKHSAVKKELVEDAFGLEDMTDILNDLVKKSILTSSENPIRKINDATVKSVCFIDGCDEENLTKKQFEVYELLKMVGKASVKELCYYSGTTISVVDAVVKKGGAQYYDEEVFRTPDFSASEDYNSPICLTDGQTLAFNEILKKYESEKGEVSLLYGITGSGKTSVFMKLIDLAYSQNKGVIVMVPEIALTPQLIHKFQSRYGKDVAVFHSALSIGERLDEWKRVKLGKAKIAIGTRSAVFAPFENLGLIIMDEEQEYTYKSESNPRFQARDIAKMRCVYNKCLLLLSSATPAIESYFSALSGKYSLSTLTERYGNAILPDVTVVDMNEERSSGNNGSFSSALIYELEKNLNYGKQSILLLNRRGYNTFVACNDCKEVVTCPNCSISLTYHSANNRLMCHYCGYSMSIRDRCPNCFGNSLRYSGAGTQRAEEELEQLFPDARILRLDTDSTLRKNAHEQKLKEFADGRYDIMVGTQMVAKGLDFPNVTLVGVLSADQMLYNDDFRSFERTFSLLTQVVGRSGRGDEKGRAIIQTSTPESQVIKLASEQNYDAFYSDEIQIRKAMLYPPFADICVLGFVGKENGKTFAAARDFLKSLCDCAKQKYSSLPMRILGVSPAAVLKINNKYRYKIIIKCRNDKNFRAMISELLISFSSNKKYKEVSPFVDINPDNIL